MNELITSSNILSADVRHYVDNALSANSRIAYRNDFNHFVAWGGYLPSTPEQVAAYLTAHASTLSIATLQRRIVSIGKAHVMAGVESPTKYELVRLTFRGIRRVHGKPQTQAAPVLTEDLTVMLSRIPDTLKGKRDRALLMLGFCAALRRSELVAIKVQDLEFTADGIILTVARSKTDQEGRGYKIGIPKARGRICPVMAVNDWLLHTGAGNDYVFRAISKGGTMSTTALSGRAVANIIKHYAKKCELPPEKYSSHSLRAGLVTSAARQGISSWVIRKQTGHKSDLMLSKYIRESNLFTNNAASIFLNS